MRGKVTPKKIAADEVLRKKRQRQQQLGERKKT
jgi:hypothetical protein